MNMFITVRTSSWHYRLASVYGTLSRFYRAPVDLREYIGHVATGMAVVFGLILGGVLIGSVVVMPAAWGLAMIVSYQYVAPSENDVVMLSILGSMSAAMMIGTILHWWNASSVSHGLFPRWYDSFIRRQRRLVVLRDE